ncbi:putative multiheme cytochrome c [Desulfuromonas soudanensis]|uniref:Putative multiheme cytochrome c n=1 Tax=Desulfuromonas soudanensis TaxID=1603606 RepID=A0A0M5IKK3_9BACT|nr:cytochrome c3 family protein [Desulfuromonas soudanensis]ALC15674.1 putative multiheme cytochrome c [Desulfuromonas soudanensis]
MGKRFLLKPLLAGLLILALLMAGCAGDDGATGVAGSPGVDGQDGAAGTPGPVGVGLNTPAIQTLTVDNLVFGKDAGGFITASFDVTDGTSAVTGLTTADSTIYLAGLVPGTAATGSDEWQYWTGVDDTALVEGPAGTYLLTSNKLDSDAPVSTTTQRGIVRMGKTGFNTVVSSYDFDIADPATAVAAGKDVVNDASCKECHGFGVTIHSYGRNDTKTCVVCHSPNYNADIAAHEADMVTMVHQIHTNKADILGALHVSGHGENWPTLAYPGTILNCAKCHNTVAQADNWKTKPTMVACNSCHTTITFDGTAYEGIKSTLALPVAGTLHTETDNSSCVFCHNSTKTAADHTPAANDDASQRLVEAVINDVVVDVDGGVTVSFSVTEDGVAKTGVTTSGTSFTLAKLVPSTAVTPSFWQSYLSKARTKDAAKAPVIQGRTEAAGDGGLLTDNGDGTYTYKFKLLNAETFNLDATGDIRTITHAHNNSADTMGIYGATALPTLAYAVPYEPTLTHRVAISLTGIKTNTFLDFVPDGVTVAETRNIVSRDACNKCHGDSRLHAGFALEYCVGCHTQNSYDPFSGPADLGVLATTDAAPAGSSSVELERIIHKIHMGKDLEKGFVLNGTHDYSNMQYPSGVPSDNRTPKASDCKVCHDESNAAMTEADFWRYGTRACGSCHDGDVATAHIDANTAEGRASCVLCHAPGKLAPVEEAHYGIQ